MNPDDNGASLNPRVRNRSLDAWAWEVWRVRVRCPYKKTPQHRRKRGQPMQWRAAYNALLQTIFVAFSVPLEMFGSSPIEGAYHLYRQNQEIQQYQTTWWRERHKEER